ncbi:MAG: carboxypeptidase CpsA [Candidatus Thermoplasmatota archaeon]|jgi:carboxypeptidase Ss1|nr:carboxypeptidase CpsA [Candidatus Thermoplasmatota archaeon]
MDVDKLRAEVLELEPELVDMRRRLHRNPELSYKEFSTSKFVADTLRKYGVEVTEKVGGTGVTGLIRGTSGKITIGLRADMDALPIEEQTGLPFASEHPGVMHACGHDSHTAMLLAAAIVLSRHKSELKGNVKFLFQPAEEDGGEGGALPMIRDGALENPHVSHVFGLHVVNDFPVGTFALRKGPIMAAPDGFSIMVNGKGGHGSAPSETVDPIYIGTQMINAIYGVRARQIDQRMPVAVSVCMVKAGSKDNIIPDQMYMEGTLRTLDESIRETMKEKIKNIAENIGGSFGASVECKFIDNAYPVTVNDPEITEEVMKVLGTIKGMKVVDIDPVMGGEDVSRFLQKAPGTYYFLGMRNEKKNIVYPNHSSRFTVDEDFLKYGAISHVLIAMNFANK